MKEGQSLAFIVLAMVLHGLISRGETARILCLSHQSTSYKIVLHAAAEGLPEKGHEVYTAYSDKMPVPKHISDKGFKTITYHTPEWSTIVGSPDYEEHLLKRALSGAQVDHSMVSNISNKECYDMENDTKFMTALGEHNFDLVILSTSPTCNCLLFIPLRFNIPFIMVIPGIAMELTRVPVLPSFSPLFFEEWSDKMSFSQRLMNLAVNFVFVNPYISPLPAIRDLTLLNKYNKDPSITSWAEQGRKAALWMVHRGPALEYIFPLMPHVINIECLTCKPGKALPSDIAQIVDSSKGIIVMTFGSLIDRLPDHMVMKFLKVFEAREETVFWRFGSQLSRPPAPNVKVMKWLPQNDLLAHPKAKLFITHGGNNGQYESAYHGVPMLSFPLFSEQHHNAKRIVEKNLGLRADLHSFTVEELSQKIEEIIGNPKYKINVQKISKMLKKNPMTAQEKSTFWIEHVLEFGADHLRSHALDMDGMSYYMFDIMIFLFIVVVAISFVLELIIRACIRFLFFRNYKKQKTN